MELGVAVAMSAAGVTFVRIGTDAEKEEKPVTRIGYNLVLKMEIN